MSSLTPNNSLVVNSNLFSGNGNGNSSGNSIAIPLIIFVIGFIIYLVIDSYKSGSGAGIIGNILALIFGFAIYILIGLYVTDTIGSSNNTMIYILNWITYSLLILTIVMVFMLVQFWSIIQKKTGPPGIRGIQGDKGNPGTSGKCSIDAEQYKRIRQLSQYIDKLYSDKTEGGSTYEPITNKFINIYLTNKIKSIFTSNQFQVLLEVFSSENRDISNLYSYIEQIWKIWFEELWKGGGEKWFKDSYADENYDWVDGHNPFTEIRKYDIYNWGLTDLFRPLKAEICQGYENNSALPYKKEPLLKIIKSNDYKWIYNDKHSKGNWDMSAWRAKEVSIAGETYYPLGDIIAAGYADNRKIGPTIVGQLETYDKSANGPDKTTLLVAGDIKPPVRYEALWTDYQQRTKGVDTNKKYRNGGDNEGSLEKPIAPEGYTCLGDVFISRNRDTKPGGKNGPKIMCVPSKCVTKITPTTKPQWKVDTDDNDNAYSFQLRLTEAHGVNSINEEKPGNEDNAYNLIRARNARDNPYRYKAVNAFNDDKMHNSDDFYIIKKECLIAPDITPKDVQPEVAKLGLAWHGNPVKSGEKYSIFSFMGLVPEGLAVNRASGRSYYLEHYGGKDFNRYLLLFTNPDTQEFTNAIQVSPIMSNNKATPMPKEADNPLQQWRIVLDAKNKKVFNLENIETKKVLYIELEPQIGSEIFRTLPNITSASGKLNALFSFNTATGVELGTLLNNPKS